MLFTASVVFIFFRKNCVYRNNKLSTLKKELMKKNLNTTQEEICTG